MRDLVRSPTPLVVLLLSLSLSACVNWRYEMASPAQVINEQHPSTVRVLRQNGASVTLAAPSVVGDSLRGFGRDRSDRISIPLSDVREVSTSHFDPLKSLGMALLVGAAAFGVVVLYALSQLSGTD